MVGLISWDAFFFFNFRSKFFNNFKKNYYCDERLLVSKKVTSVISLNVQLWLDVILVVLIVTIELSIVRKKNRVPPNVTKVRSGVMWVLPNVIMEQSNLRIKK